METMTSSKPVLSDFESGSKKESSALHRLPSVAISEASLIIEQPFEASLLIAEVPCKALNESMTEALSVTPGMMLITDTWGILIAWPYLQRQFGKLLNILLYSEHPKSGPWSDFRFNFMPVPFDNRTFCPDFEWLLA
jgi:hypothetical protein